MHLEGDKHTCLLKAAKLLISAIDFEYVNIITTVRKIDLNNSKGIDAIRGDRFAGSGILILLYRQHPSHFVTSNFW